MHVIHKTAHAKINLSLRVVGKRADGYHLLESLVVFAEYGDEITVRESNDLSLDLTGSFAGALKQEPLQHNLVWKAALALQKLLPVPKGASITLNKKLPIASGIGGGSADAAATLHALCELWELQLPDETLAEIGLSLGSDVPVCLYGKASIMRGVGEEITPFSISETIYMVLINPNIPLATAEVFRAYSQNKGTRPRNKCEVTEYTNDLEDAAISLQPIIGDILVSLSYTKGCYMVNMSGSGATCYGLYRDKLSADNACAELQKNYPNFWCVSTLVK